MFYLLLAFEEVSVAGMCTLLLSFEELKQQRIVVVVVL
jgi:hypothetical protein